MADSSSFVSSEAMSESTPGPVRRRRVYYLSGFDPRGAAFYHRLYREEAAKQMGHYGADVQVSPRSRHDSRLNVWTVTANWGGQEVSTDYQFLGWDDIIRRHWEPNVLRLLLSSVPAYLSYMACGAFARIRQTSPGPFYSAIYPFIYLLLLTLVALMCGGALAAGVAYVSPQAVWSWAAGVLGAGACFWFGLRWANVLGIFWLLRTYLFVHRWGVSPVEDLESRIDAFADKVALDLKTSAFDEVLLVGHSVGSILAVSVAARLLEKLPEQDRARIALVTLGQCIPLLSFIPSATRFRQDLARLGNDPDMPWLDMTARADPLCFSQLNPIHASGIEGVPANRPQLGVVRPFRMFEKKSYECIRRNKLRLHFQYLMASELLTEYDYFRMTAGPERLHLS